MSRHRFTERDYALVLDEIRADPMAVAREYSDAHVGTDHRIGRQRYEWLAVAVAFAMEIANSDELVSTFLSDQFWLADVATPKRKNLLRLVMRYFLRAPASGSLYDRACTYAWAMEGFFVERTDPKRIPQEIENAGGIEKLYACRRIASEERRKSDASPIRGVELPTSSQVEEPNPLAHLTEDGGSTSVRRANIFEPDGKERSRPSPPMPRFNRGRHILVDAEEELLFSILDIAPGKRILLEITVEESPSDFKIFRTVAFQKF